MILDTNAVSAIAEGDPKAASEFSRARHVEIPVIVLGEFRFGIGGSRHRLEYEAWLEKLTSVCRILEIHDETASVYASIRAQLRQAGTPIPSNDTWIAALSRQHALPVLSRDRHFDLVAGIRRIGW